VARKDILLKWEAMAGEPAAEEPLRLGFAVALAN